MGGGICAKVAQVGPQLVRSGAWDILVREGLGWLETDGLVPALGPS